MLRHINKSKCIRVFSHKIFHKHLTAFAIRFYNNTPKQTPNQETKNPTADRFLFNAAKKQETPSIVTLTKNQFKGSK